MPTNSIYRVYANARNTPSVRSGHEPSGYEKLCFSFSYQSASELSFKRKLVKLIIRPRPVYPTPTRLAGKRT